MQIKFTPILTQTEHAMWTDLVLRLQSVCHEMKCPNNIDCCECPLDALTDHAYSLADEINDMLHECQTERKGE